MRSKIYSFNLRFLLLVFVALPFISLSQTFNGSTINTAGNSSIPSTGTGGCGVEPQTAGTGGTRFNCAVAGVPGGSVLRSVNINFTHTFTGDIDMYLISPAGAVLELSTDNGGGGDNFTNTEFRDDATNNITTGTAPFTGQFRPEGSLTGSVCGITVTPTVTTVAGLGTTAGTWQLLILDDAGGDVGVMLNWSLVFVPATPPCSGVPSPGSISPSTTTTCSGSSVTLTLSGYSNATGLTFQWRSSATSGGPYTDIAGATTPVYTFTAASTLYYVCVVTCTNAGGGSATTSQVVVNVSNIVQSNVAATPPVSCSPGSTVITATAAGGIGNYTHTLTGPGTIGAAVVSGPNNSNVSFTVTNIPAGVHTYTLTSTDAVPCSRSTTVNVTVNPTPVVTINPAASVICAGNVQQLTATVVPGLAQTFSSGTLNLAIPDGSAAGVTTPAISIPAGTSINAASDLSVRINMNPGHTWVGDLIFRLNSPCGTTFLFDRPGVPPSSFGNSQNLSGVYTFNLSAATILPETSSGPANIPAGSYLPSNAGGTAHNWAGATFPCTATGNWTLTMSDNAFGDAGTLADWSIIVSTPLPVVFSPVTNLFTDPAATVAYTGTPVNTVYAKPPTTTTYTATATLAGCIGTATSTITVNQLPAITVQPQALAAPICPGFNVNYSVTATGAGLTYQWQISTNNGSTWTNLVNNGTQYAGVTTSTLTLLNVQTTQNGHQFRVIVSGTCPPPVTSSAVTLVVATAPVITTQPASRTVCAGVNATFTAAATGVPAPTIYQWQVSTNGGATWTNLTTGDSYTTTLTVSPTTTSMSGYQYRLVFTNSCGQSTNTNAATLTVNPVPVVTATDLSTRRICLSDTLVPLVGTPSGGSWSGIGVSGFNFVPTATAVGAYTLTYTYTNTFGCTASGTTIARVIDCPERIRLLRDNAVILFPNPNKGQFNIRINSVLYNYLGMNVYNTAGQLITQKTFSGLAYGRTVPIDLTHLPSGTYMVKFFYDDGIRTSEKTFPVIIGRD